MAIILFVNSEFYFFTFLFPFTINTYEIGKVIVVT